VISCRLPAIQGRNECDQLWVTDDTGGTNVISCGLPTIQGRNECDQLWVTGDTGEE